MTEYPAQLLEADAKERARQYPEEIFKNFLWMAVFDRAVELEDIGATCEEGLRDELGDDEPEAGGREELDDEAQGAVMKALDAARGRIAALPHAHCVFDFKVRVLGGDWTALNEDSPLSSAQGYAMHIIATRLCIRRVAQRSMRFDEKLNGGISRCMILARAWCHRM